MRRTCAQGGALLVLACAIGACGSVNKKTVVVYSPHGKEMLGEFEAMFERAHPDVDVRWLDMGSQDAFDRIRTEKGNPQADVWWGAPSTVFARAEKESLLEHYRPTWDTAVSEEFKSAAGFWYGTIITPEVIMYNSRMVVPEEAPRDWDDLLDRKWRNRIIIRYPLASGTMRGIFCAIIQRERTRTGSLESGFDWLRRLDANTKTYAADPTQLYLKIGREEGAVSLWNLTDVVFQASVNGYPFAFVVPESGTPLITDCIALVRTPRDKSAAAAFYEFVTSVISAEIQASRFFRIPARRDVPRSSLPPWMRELEINPLRVDWNELAAMEQEWMARWEEDVRGKGQREGAPP